MSDDVVRPIRDGVIAALRRHGEAVRDARAELDRAIAYARHVGLTEQEIADAAARGTGVPQPAHSTPAARAEARQAAADAIAAAKHRRTEAMKETP